LNSEVEQVTCARWNHGSGKAKLALGHQEGQIELYDLQTDRCTLIDRGKFDRESPVIDIQWYDFAKKSSFVNLIQRAISN
jgi:hypothetical protein